MKLNNINLWFKNIDVEQFYINDFETNFTNHIPIPYYITKNFDDTKLKKLKEALFNLAITHIFNSPKVKHILDRIDFELLEQDTQFYLRQAVCAQVQVLCENKSVLETTLRNSVQSPNFSISNEPSNYIKMSSPIGNVAFNYINKSGIAEYQWVNECDLYRTTTNGNIFIITKETI